MSLTYITECDGCKKRVEGWGNHMLDEKVWYTVTRLGDEWRRDYCVGCWDKVQDVLR